MRSNGNLNKKILRCTVDRIGLQGITSAISQCKRKTIMAAKQQQTARNNM